jgi:hypothetical protein
MGDYIQLSMDQLETIHKIYTTIGVKPFKSIDHADLFSHHMLIGLHIKGSIKKHIRKGKERGNTWIITNVGISEAKRYERIMYERS